MPAIEGLKGWLQERQYASPYHWTLRANDEHEYQLRTRVVLELAGLTASPDGHAAGSGVPDAATVRLLDVGCGDGRFTSAAIRHARSTGVDISHRALAFGRTLVPGALFARSAGHALPFPSNTFDVVTLLDVIEHVPDAAERHTIDEAHRVLRPGGRLIVSTNTSRSRCELKHYRHYPLDRFERLFDRFSNLTMVGLIPYFPTLRFWMAAPIAGRLARSRIRTCAPEVAHVVVGAGSK